MKKKIKFVEGSFGHATQCKYCSYYGDSYDYDYDRRRCTNPNAEYYNLYNDPDQYCLDGD